LPRDPPDPRGVPGEGGGRGTGSQGSDRAASSLPWRSDIVRHAAARARGAGGARRGL